MSEVTEKDYEELIILVLFKMGATMRGLARKFKKKGPEIEEIIRVKWDELGSYKPLARRKKND